MKRYLVKEVSKATAENPNFAGKVITSWFGKGDTLLDRTSAGGFDWLAKKYGYKRLGDAKRNWTYNHPQNDRYWQSTVEIVEMEV